MKKTFLFLLLAMLGVGSTRAQFSGGSGTEDDPYLIATEDDLYDISTNLSAHYKLTRDLDLTEWIKDENPKLGWEPIGTSAKPFTGSFDGNGKTISGLFINRTSGYVGLFGYAEDATFRNLNLDGPRITGNGYAGALVGYGVRTIIAGIRIKDVTIQSPDNAGSLAGYIELLKQQSAPTLDETSRIETVEDIHVENAKVSGSTNIGGVMGSFIVRAYYSISHNICCHDIEIENGVVTGTSQIGGVFGMAQNALNNSASYSYDIKVSNVSVKGDTRVGGVVGKGDYDLRLRYLYVLNGNVSATTNYAGGLVGYSEADVYLRYCYVSGNVESGGIACGIGYVYHKTNSSVLYTIKNRFDVRVKGGSTAYGLSNNSSYHYCDIFTGSVYGNQVYGMYGNAGATQYCVACADTLSAKTSLCRIGPGSTSCYAYNQTVLLLNGEETEVNDDASNGIGKSMRLLKRRNSYEGDAMYFDFENDWAIVEGVTLPYLINQSVPAEIKSIANGKVSGTATGSGKVSVFVGQTKYEGTVTDGTWEVSVGPLEAGTEVRVSVETEGKQPSIITKAKAGDAVVTDGDHDEVTLTSTYATYCSANALDFSSQTNLKAYAATGYEDGRVVLTRVYVVPAGEGVLLKGDAGTYRVERTGATSFFTNLLKGVSATTTVAPTEGSQTNFILANGSHGTGFYPIAAAGPLAAGKAYLQLPTALFNASSRMLQMALDDETSGMAAGTATENGTHVGPVYDMQGRNVANRQLQKGLYVSNGKKIIIK